MKSFHSKGFLAALLLLSLSGRAMAEARNPLYDRMKGIWTAEGERVAAISGKRVRIRTETESEVVDGVLISRNRLTETPADGSAPAQTYERTFWIAPAPGVLAIQEGKAFDVVLGYGVDPAQGYSGQGKFARDTDGTWMLKSVQPMGGYRVVSISRFVDHETVEYLEQFLRDDQVLAETRLTYERVWLGNPSSLIQAP